MREVWPRKERDARVILVLMLSWAVPQYNCNLGSTEGVYPSCFTTPKKSLCVYLPQQLMLCDGKGAYSGIKHGNGAYSGIKHGSPCDMQGIFHGKSQQVVLFALPPFFFGGRFKVHVNLQVGCRRSCLQAKRNLEARIWRLSAKGDSEGREEASSKSQKATPLSQWISEIEKDLVAETLSQDWPPPIERQYARKSNSNSSAVPRTPPRESGATRPWQVVRQQGADGSAEKERAQGKYDTAVLRDLTKFRQLEELLDALEPFVDAPEGVMTAPQAVAAMNHLKRLYAKGKSRAKPAEGGAGDLSKWVGGGGIQGSLNRLYRDSLTGVVRYPNAAMVEERVEERVERCMRSHAAGD